MLAFSLSSPSPSLSSFLRYFSLSHWPFFLYSLPFLLLPYPSPSLLLAISHILSTFYPLLTLKIIKCTIANAEAVAFWRHNGFGTEAAIDKVVDALYTHALLHGRLPEELLEAPAMDNLALVAFLVSNQDKQLVSVHRFTRFVGQSASLCDALEKYVNVPGKPPASTLSAEEQQHALCQQTLKPVTFQAELARLQDEFVEGTCESVFANVEQWMALSEGAEHHRVYWVQGTAGLGKSIIAAQLIKRYGGTDSSDANGLGTAAETTRSVLAAHFLCKHDDPMCNDLRLVVATLGFGLAVQVPAVGAVYAAMLATETGRQEITAHVTGQGDNVGDLDAAFEALLAAPLRQAVASASSPDVFLLVDALDELRPSPQRAALLSLLGQKLPTLPACVRVIVTSRPEAAVVEALGDLRPLVLTQNDVQQQDDLAAFVQQRVVAETSLATASTSEQQAAVEAVQAAVAGVFRAARLTGHVLRQYDQELLEGSESGVGLTTAHQVRDLLEAAEGLAPLHAAYAAELKRIDTRVQQLADGDGDALLLLRAAVRRMLAVVLAAERPLSLTELAALSLSGLMEPSALTTVDGSSTLSSTATTQELLSALTLLYPAHEAGAGVQPLHKTFLDFLRAGDAKRGIAKIDVLEGHTLLLRACMQLSNDDCDSKPQAYVQELDFEATHCARCAMPSPPGVAATAPAVMAAKSAADAWLQAREAEGAVQRVLLVTRKLKDFGAYQTAVVYGQHAVALQPNNADALLTLGDALEAHGLVDDAMEQFQQALAIRRATAGEDHLDTAKAYAKIAWIAGNHQSKHTLALELYNKALAIQRAALGENDAGTATCYHGMAVVYEDQGQYERALELYASALAIRQAVLGENDVDTANTFYNMSNVYDAQGNHEKALECCLKALAIERVTLGESHARTAMTYHNLGLVCDNQGDDVSALAYYSKALAIRLDTLPENHVDTASTYNNMGVVHDHRGEYEDALECYSKALVIRLATLGENHADTAGTFYNMATVYKVQEEYERALEFFSKALATMGMDDADTAMTYHAMAGIYDAQEDYDHALEYYFKALAACKATRGENHAAAASTYHAIACVYKSQNNSNQALEYYFKALAVQRATLGSHASTARTYCNIAIVYGEQTQYGLALKYYTKSLTTYRATVGETHTETAVAFFGMAVVYHEQGQLELALESYANALKIRLATLGESHTDTASVYNNIASVFSDQGDHERALEYYSKALVIYSGAQEEHYTDAAGTHYNMASIYSSQGKQECALEHYHKALDAYRFSLGETHSKTAMVCHSLAAVYQTQGKYEQALELCCKARTIYTTTLGEHHADVGDTLYDIGGLYKSRNDLTAAAESFRGAHFVYLSSYGPDHAETLDAAQRVVQCS